MLTSLASYIWGSAEEEAPAAAAPNVPHATTIETAHDPKQGTLKARQADNEWVFVETSSSESSPARSHCLRGTYHAPHEDLDFGKCDPLTPLTATSAYPGQRPSPTDIMHSSQSDTCSDISTLPDIPGNEESWLVTPPPCFTAGARSPMADALETSSMENLLIEHPSMSVYASRGRHNSEGVDSQHSESDSGDDTDMLPMAATQGHVATMRHPPRRPSAVAQRVGLVTSQKVIQYATRSVTRAMLHRHNMVYHCMGRGKQAARRGRIIQPVARGLRRC